MKYPNTALHAVGALALTALVAAGLTACSSTTATSAESPLASAGFPLTIENCGSEVTLDAPAERIVLVNSDAVANIEALGAVDRVVAITSALAPDLYEEATYTALESLDMLSTEQNATGGSIVSQESILAAEPDLVIAPENAVDRAALAANGIALYSPSAYCNDPSAELSATATFDRVWDEVRSLGSLLGESDKAEEVVADGKSHVEAAAPAAGTAVALYVSSGGSVLSPYGAPSMVTPVFAAAGLENVYADTEERVFDVNVEDIIARNPGTIVLLYSGDDPQATIDSFLSSAAAASIPAVAAGRVIALPFPYTDPPSMLSIEGPGELSARLAELG